MFFTGRETLNYFEEIRHGHISVSGLHAARVARANQIRLESAGLIGGNFQ